MGLIVSSLSSTGNGFNDVLLILALASAMFWPFFLIPIALFAIAMFKPRARTAGVGVIAAFAAPILVYWALLSVPSVGRAVSFEVAGIGLLLSWAVGAWFAFQIVVKLNG